MHTDVLTTLTVSPGEVSALDHEVRDDSVEVGANIPLAARTGVVARRLVAQTLQIQVKFVYMYTHDGL